MGKRHEQAEVTKLIKLPTRCHFRGGINWEIWSDICTLLYIKLGFPGGSDSKESACSARYPGSIPGLGRSPGREHSNPHQYSFLENPMDRGAWWATVHRIARNRTQLKQLSTAHTRPYGLRVSRDEFKSENQSLHWKRRNGEESARNMYSNSKRITLDDEKGCRDGESSTKTALEEPQTPWTSRLPFL